MERLNLRSTIFSLSFFLFFLFQACTEPAHAVVHLDSLSVKGQSIMGSQATPAASAILDLESTTKGLLPPQMTTTQQNAISSPASGLALYDNVKNLLAFYNGTAWLNLATQTGTETLKNKTIQLADGNSGTPSLSYVSEPTTGWYRAGTGDLVQMVAGTQAAEYLLASGNVNVGFGPSGTIGTGASNPFSMQSSNNGTQYFQWGNSSAGANSVTVFEMTNGSVNLNNATTAENWANNTANAYLGGSSVFSGTAFQTGTFLMSENSSGFIAFDVGGRTLATERARLTPTAFTLNKGTNLVLSGATSGSLALNAGATGTYSLTFPTANAQGVWINNGSGGVSFSASPTLGVNGTSGTSGTLALANGVTGGASVTVQNGGATTAYNFVLPTTVGASGTFLTSQAGSAMTWTSALSDPTSALGDTIYRGASALTALSGNTTATTKVLTQTGTGSVSAAPAWAALPGSFYWSGYYPSSATNFWSNANTSTGDFTVNGTIPAPTALQTANWSAVSKATSNLPGINFSAPRTGTIKCTVMVSLLPNNGASSTSYGLTFVESTTSTTVAFFSGTAFGSGTAAKQDLYTMVGYFPATASTTYNFKLQGLVGAGTMFIGAENSTYAQLSFAFEYIN